MPINVVVPEVGESVVDARVAQWLRQEGDLVAAGDPLVELETDKVDVEVAAPQAGVLGKILHPNGADVKIGAVLATIEAAPAGAAGSAPTAPPTDAAAATATGEKQKPAAKPAAAAPPIAAQPAATAPAAASSARREPVAATPSARKTAREHDVPLAGVAPAGPRVTRSDVERAAAAQSTPAPRREPGARVDERVRMSKRRATIARRLVEAQHVAAMLTTFNEIDMSGVASLRERHKDSFKKTHGVSLGLSAFFVKAAIAALKDFPRVNAEIQGDEMVLKHYYDIGIAVGAAEGLVVPVLRDADTMSFAAIEQTIRGFADKASQGTLSLDDLRGGTFSITNGGVFGSLMSTPIINPPQSAILGLHAIKDRPVGVNGQIVLRPMMYVALTYDHRIVDGAEAVQFLVRIKTLVEDPGGLLIQT